MSQELNSNPLYLNYGVGDLEGNSICSKISLPKGFNLNSNNKGKYSEVIRDKEFKVTNFGISTTTGKPRIAIGYPVFNKNNKVIGAVWMSMNLNIINHYISDLNLPKNSEFIITDDKGKIIVISPVNTDILGKEKFDTNMFSLILARQKGIINKVDKSGKNHLYAYSPYFINDNKDYTNFMIYGVEYERGLINIPDSFSPTLVTLLILSVLAETLIIMVYLLKLKKTMIK